MIKFHYTAGPWRWIHGEPDSTDEPKLLGPNDQIICHFGNNETYYPSEGSAPAGGDKDLIGMAPEMFEALCGIADAVGKVSAEEAAWFGLVMPHAVARAIIERITGRKG